MDNAFKPLNQLNSFFELASEKTLSGSDQLVYLHLYNKFNRAHWTETILVDDAELLKLINWYESNGKPASVATVRKAKQRLKKKGFIDFTSGSGSNVTEYRLIKLYPVDTPVDTPIDTPIDTPVDTLRRSNNTCAKEDVEDVKTFLKPQTPARANSKNSVTPNLDRELEEKINAAVRELDKDVRSAWIETKSENPYGGDLLDLVDLQKRYGAKTLADTITYCRRNRQPNHWGGSGEVNINYIQRVIAKGGTKSGNIVKFPASTESKPDIWDAQQSDLPF